MKIVEDYLPIGLYYNYPGCTAEFELDLIVIFLADCAERVTALGEAIERLEHREELVPPAPEFDLAAVWGRECEYISGE